MSETMAAKPVPRKSIAKSGKSKPPAKPKTPAAKKAPAKKAKVAAE
jgi:hypothetical protein